MIYVDDRLILTPLAFSQKTTIRLIGDRVDDSFSIRYSVFHGERNDLRIWCPLISRGLVGLTFVFAFKVPWSMLSSHTSIGFHSIPGVFENYTSREGRLIGRFVENQPLPESGTRKAATEGNNRWL
jgi:hypothetical protein